MVKLQKIRTESPATALGVLSFSLDTGAPKITPYQVFGFILLFVIVELLLLVFYPL